MALFQYFSRNDLEQVHATVLRLMNEVGVRFPHEPALQVLKKAGCRVDADRVRFPGNIVEDAVRKAPSKFTIYGPNPEQKVEIGGDNIVFLPCYDVIVEGAEKCDFLGHPHTLENFRTELHVPTLSFRSSYFEWVEKGCRTSLKQLTKNGIRG